MKQPNKTREYILERATVDIISDEVRDFLTVSGVDKRDVIRYIISIEEILIKSLEKAEGAVKIKLETGTRFFRPFISLSVGGRPDNEYLNEENSLGIFAGGMLRNLGLSPEYNYNGEFNNYYFRLKKKSINPFVSLIIALVSAFCVGFLGLLLPNKVITGVLNSFLSPVHDTFFSILGCIAGPMVFLSVAWGIYGMGDAATLKKVGKKILSGYISTVYIVLILCTLLVFPMFKFNLGTSSGNKSEISAIFSMLLGIVPSNIFSPFVEGNTLQIIFLAVVIGIAMLFLGKKTNAVALAVEQINYIVQFLIEFISRLVPYFIFIVIVKMIWSDSAEIFLRVGKLFAVFLIAVLFMAIILFLYTSIRNKVSVFSLIKKGLPTLLIAITTASSAAAFGNNMTACKKEFGIDDKISSFGIPLGMVIFKPTTSLNYMVMALFFAEMYDVKISAAWLVAMVFSAGVLACATPPIPGGALTAYTVLFTQLGIPAEALAIALASDTLFDFVDTGFDEFLLPVTLLDRANRLGMVDYDILKNKNKKLL